uniref:Uncharacterized protein n=1 Tax=Anopheles dirus TaxID=7168 RepID=A0A182NXH8_9DIPT
MHGKATRAANTHGQRQCVLCDAPSS